MRFQVLWQAVAEQELAAIWLAAPDRAAVTAAAAYLDNRLADDPMNLGESRASPLRRVAFRTPFGVEFDVVPDDMRVFVRGVFPLPLK